MITKLSVSKLAQIAGTSSSDDEKLTAASAAIFKIAKLHMDEIEEYIDFRSEISQKSLEECYDHLAVIRQAQLSLNTLCKMHEDRGHGAEKSLLAYVELFKVLEATASKHVGTLAKCFAR